MSKRGHISICLKYKNKSDYSEKNKNSDYGYYCWLGHKGTFRAAGRSILYLSLGGSYSGGSEKFTELYM